MTISKIWIWLALIVAALLALASGAGVFISSVYSKETASWAAQGVGQDMVNLFIAFPALLISLYFVNKGSIRALLVCLGILIYIVYSYVIYAFFTHFNFLFLIYVSLLGLSFYTLLGSVISLKRDELSRFFTANTKAKAVSIFLMAVVLLFATLWLSDIVPALLKSTAPNYVAEIGLPVNPVHVLDLAIFLPGTAITSVLLWKRKILGFLFAVPLLTFAAVMGIAIISMSLFMNARDIPAPLGSAIFIGVIVLISLYLMYKFLNETK